MSWFSCFLVLLGLLQMAACDNAAGRKAREEAAVNAGEASPVDGNAGIVGASDGATRALAAEAAAAGSADGALAALPSPAQLSQKKERRAEIPGVVADMECPSGVSAEHCAATKASFAIDMHGLVDEEIKLCAQQLSRAESAQRELIERSTDLNADLAAAEQLVTRSREYLLENCMR